MIVFSMIVSRELTMAATLLLFFCKILFYSIYFCSFFRFLSSQCIRAYATNSHLHTVKYILLSEESCGELNEHGGFYCASFTALCFQVGVRSCRCVQIRHVIAPDAVLVYIHKHTHKLFLNSPSPRNGGTQVLSLFSFFCFSVVTRQTDTSTVMP